ncbi:MAG: oxidoreductase, partial [Bacteroidales bacterium]|nr:oxidoreductase [Bacteroidales bacterium]
VAPAYSATKAMQNTYIQSLSQLARIKKADISFTDIRPGFVATDLLNSNKHYPLLMKKEKVAKAIVKALKSKKRVLVIDWKFRIVVFFWRLIPSCIWERISVKN